VLLRRGGFADTADTLQADVPQPARHRAHHPRARGNYRGAGRPAHEGALRAPRRPARGSTRAASGTGLCSARESPDAFSTNG
jgi:hypothetical protein